jgi:hypothetical protein
MTDPSGLRVADADRESLISELREHMLAGRLSAEEFEDRLGAAYRARTRADLDALRADLPMSAATMQGALAERRARLRRSLLQEGGGALGISALCVAVWAASGAEGSFWPIWVIIASLIPIVRNAWLLLGPAPDHDALEANLRASRSRHIERSRRRSRRDELPR